MMKRILSKKIKEKRSFSFVPFLLLIGLCIVFSSTFETKIVHGAQVGSFAPPYGLWNVYHYDTTFMSSGMVEFQITGAPVLGVSYLNVILDWNSDGTYDAGEWVIQNDPIANSNLNAYGHLVYFPLTVVMSGSVDTYAVVNDTMINITPPWTIMSPFIYLGLPPLSNHTFSQPGQSGAAPPAGPPAGAGAALPKGRAGMRDIPQKSMECGPTSTTNSMIWLAERDGWVNDLLKAVGRPLDGDIEKSNTTNPANISADELAIIEKFKAAMHPPGATPFPGLNGDELKDGKELVLGDGIKVHGGMSDANARGAKLFDFIKEELAKGQDVEMLIVWPGGGAHWVTAVDISFDGAGNVTVSVIDSDDGRGTAARAYVAEWKAKINGTFSSPAGTAGWAVAESPDPTLVTLIFFTATEVGELILLEWNTVSEHDSVGFHIWRSEEEDGGYVRITDSLIPSEGGDTWGASYEFEDTNTAPDTTYDYRLENIEGSGNSIFYGMTSVTRSPLSEGETPVKGAGSGCFIETAGRCR
jgi:hypothetical protein